MGSAWLRTDAYAGQRMNLLIDLRLLSVMPTVQTALRSIEEHATTRRLTIIRHPDSDPDLLRFWLRSAVSALPGHTVVKALVGEGTNVALAVANAAQLSSQTVQAQALDDCSGRFVHVLLCAADVAGTGLIESYAVAFAKCSGTTSAGGLCLYVVDPELKHELTDDGPIGVIQLTDMLSPEEMSAYVTIRTATSGRRGPGQTNLSRALVERFAGSDPRMAEVLMSMTDEELASLPASMPIDRLPPAPSSARKRLMHEDDPHLLFQSYRSPNAAQAKVAERKLLAHFRSACVQALMPWLEVCRFIMIERLKPVLEDYANRTGGLMRHSKGRPRPIELDVVEFNDVVVWERHHDLQLLHAWSEFRSEYEACEAASSLRNGIAHAGGASAQVILRCVAMVERAFG